jgi:UDP-glucose 4-epimerase
VNILVTGGLGFIGSHLVDSLLDTDNNITVMDDLRSESSDKKYIRESVDYWIDDIRNISSSKYKSKQFDIIYHLGALARIQPSFKNPVEYISINSMGTALVCERAREMNAKIVYAGSSSAYGGPMLNPYSFAKYEGEKICEMYSKVYNLSTVTARFFNVYGDRQPIIGPYATVVGIFEQKYLKKEPLTIIGTGEQRRDFTHVSDIVSGLVALGKDRWSSEIFNLGSGKNYSINELAKMFGGETVFLDPRPGESRVTLADYTSMKRKTGWNPKINLESYIKEWKRENTSG